MSEYIQTTDSFSAESQLMDYFNGRYSNYDEGEKYLAYSNIDLIYRTKFDTVELGEANLKFYTNNPGVLVGGYIQSIDEKVEKQKWYIDTIEARGSNIIRLDVPQKALYSLFENEGTNKDIYILNINNFIISSTRENMIGKHSDQIQYVEDYMLDNLDKANSFEVDHGEKMVYCDLIKTTRTYDGCKIIENRKERSDTCPIFRLFHLCIPIFLGMSPCIFLKRLTEIMGVIIAYFS